jgi:predicted amidophosphoribosyltransferase
MSCPSCGHENRAGRKFCVQCGAGIELACPSCGAKSEPGERFCGEWQEPSRLTDGLRYTRATRQHTEAPH